MHLIDITGAIACHRHTNMLALTAGVDSLDFIHPIKVGDLIILKSRVTCVFNTSLEVEVEVFSEADSDRRAEADEQGLSDVRVARSETASRRRCRRWWSKRRKTKSAAATRQARRAERLKTKSAGPERSSPAPGP